VSVDAEQLRKVERTLTAGTWVIVFGAVLYSVLTVTPLVAAHTPAGWRLTAPILPVVVDTAVVIVTRLDAALARLNASSKDRGPWPWMLRWMTGLMTLLLNVGAPAAAHDVAGALIHAVAPLLLIVTAEAGLAYRRALAAAVARREQQAREEREAREQAAREREEARERRAREEREARERAEREAREHAARLAREEREHAAALAREQAEREERARREREAFEREQQRLAAEQAARERAEREAREQAGRERERLAREQAAQEREREQRAREQYWANAPHAAPGAKLEEQDARRLVFVGNALGASVRQIAERTGWSVGWVSARIAEGHGPAGGRELTAA
jgi:flagellar biosynthesis GTPase FlhF